MVALPDRDTSMQDASVPSQIYPILHDLANPYDVFLDGRRYVASSREGLLRITDAAREHFAGALQDGTWKLSPELHALPGLECIPAGDLGEGMLSLGPQFDIACGGVLIMYEMQREAFRKGCQKILSSVAPHDTSRIHNSFLLALQHYLNGCQTTEGMELFRESLRQFRVAVEGHRVNPAAHLHIGHLYHYQAQLRDFTKAWDHYNLCYLTALGDTDLHPIGAQGCFYAGWLSAAVFGNLNEAITWSQHALDLDPNLCEARYHLVKLYALTGNAPEAIAQLRALIDDGDARYCQKLCVDQDFRAVRDDFTVELYEIACRHIGALENALADPQREFSSLLRMRAQDELDVAKKLCASSDVYEFLWAIVHIDEVWRKDAEDRRNRETAAPEAQRGVSAADAGPRAEAVVAEDAEQEARMKEALKARMESVMKARIEEHTTRERRKGVRRNLLSLLVVMLAAMAVASFSVFGVTLTGFILVLCASIALLVRALL
jgi:tetratricopeptide (TPR) repeat protein